MKITKVYTRRGDSGKTELIGGIRISKTDIRLEAYGTVDELSSHLGLLHSIIPADNVERDMLLRIQNTLFNIGSHLATDQSQTPLRPYAMLPEGETTLLEQHIDAMIAMLPEPQGFVLPGGTPAAAQSHVCRTVCRRAERCIIALADTAKVGPEIIEYINRLSDYLFVLAKIINFNAHQDEIIWQNACK